MNSDIRLAVGFWQHPKTRKLAKRLGLEGVRSLQILWLWASQNKPDGDLSGMDWEDIELAADWTGEERAFFDYCLGVWIDETESGYVLHDWKEHNPWASEAGDRSDKARFSRLATVNRAEFERLKEAGVNAISKEEYERLTDVQRHADETSTNRQRNANVPPTPAPAPALNAFNTLTTFECVSKSELSDPVHPKLKEEKNPIVELTDEDDSGGQGKVPPCPQKTIVEAYHELLLELPRVRTWRANSATALRTRWREKWKEGKFADVSGGVGYFRRFFEYVQKSDFLMGRKTGRDGRSFVCTLVWILQARHFDDIIAGKYHDPDREAA